MKRRRTPRNSQPLGVAIAAALSVLGGSATNDWRWHVFAAVCLLWLLRKPLGALVSGLAGLAWSRAKARRGAQSGQDFYRSPQWRRLRYDALKAADGRCQLCGKGKHDGVKLHVDHVKPRSLFPRLALRRDNLQVLCDACNLGKSNRCTRDWRRQTA